MIDGAADSRTGRRESGPCGNLGCVHPETTRHVKKLSWLGALPPPSRDLPRARRDVLIQLALAMGEDGSGWVRDERLAEEAAVSVTTVRRAREWAVIAGLLARTLRGHRAGDTGLASEYQLLQPVSNPSLNGVLNGDVPTCQTDVPTRQTGLPNPSPNGTPLGKDPLGEDPLIPSTSYSAPPCVPQGGVLPGFQGFDGLGDDEPIAFEMSPGTAVQIRRLVQDWGIVVDADGRAAFRKTPEDAEDEDLEAQLRRHYDAGDVCAFCDVLSITDPAITAALDAMFSRGRPFSYVVNYARRHQWE